MKRIQPFIVALSLMMLSACEETNEVDTLCFPDNMTATIILGSATTKIIADFHYVSETDLLDHITWSNHQTHYFDYDESDRLEVVRQFKVDLKVQEEMWFQYNGELIERVLLVTRNLDYVFLEPLDSIYAGHIDYTYVGKDIILEIRYEVNIGNGNEEAVEIIDYVYDLKGNIMSAYTSDPRTSSGELRELTYHDSKHPYSGIRYYFSGESYVNNIRSLSVEAKNLNYHYDLQLNDFGYPETIYEKLGSTNTRIIRYSYTCK